jgi:hypothetical protein
VQSFSPITPEKEILDKQSADGIVNRTNDTFDFTILRGCEWARHPELCAIRQEKIRVEELSNSRPLSHWMALIFLPN